MIAFLLILRSGVEYWEDEDGVWDEHEIEQTKINYQARRFSVQQEWFISSISQDSSYPEQTKRTLK